MCWAPARRPNRRDREGLRALLGPVKREVVVRAVRQVRLQRSKRLLRVKRTRVHSVNQRNVEGIPRMETLRKEALGQAKNFGADVREALESTVPLCPRSLRHRPLKAACASCALGSSGGVGARAAVAAGAFVASAAKAACV